MDSKKTKQANFRFDDETFAKLEDLKAKSGLDVSKLVRKLILDGKVEVHYGQREIMKKLSSIHDSFNQSMLEFRHDEQRLQKSVDALLEAAKSNNDARIQIAAEKAEGIVDFIAEKCMDKHRTAEMEMKDCVDFQRKR